MKACSRPATFAAPLTVPSEPPWPHHVGCDVLERATGLVLVEHARQVFSGDPDLLSVPL